MYARALHGWARDKARDVSGQRVKWASGAVTFVQRAGSALNLSVHFHTLAPDTAWWMDDDGKVHRVDLPPPTDDEVAKLLKTLVQRIARCLRRRGILDEAGWVRANTYERGTPWRSSGAKAQMTAGPSGGAAVARNWMDFRSTPTWRSTRGTVRGWRSYAATWRADRWRTVA